MKHFFELDQSQFPKFSNEQHQQLLEFHNQNCHLSNMSEKFVRLFPYTITGNAPTKKQFFTDLLKEYSIPDEILECLATFNLRRGLPAHRDRAAVSLLYIIEGKAQTSWWSNGDAELKSWSTSEPAILYKHDKLTRIETTVFKLHTWYLIDNNTIHSVINLTDSRTALTCSLGTMYKSFEDAKNSVENFAIHKK